MEDYLIFKFTKCLYDYFGISNHNVLEHKFIYFEKEKFRSKGDISILRRHLNFSEENVDLVIEESQKSWCFPLRIVNISSDHFHIFLNKEIVFRETFLQVEQKLMTYGFYSTNKKIFLQKDSNVKNSLTQLRIDLALDLTQRIAKKLGYDLSTDSDEHCQKYFFTNRSGIPSGYERIFVMGMEDGKKKCELTSEDYLRLISTEVSRMSDRLDPITTSANQLVDICIKFNLFHANVSSPSKLAASGDTSHNSKDAIFVVYNYVRLKAILNTYETKVSENVYPPLPSLGLTDFSLLSKEEEWGILLDHIVRFPQLVAEFSTKLDKESKLHLHGFFIMLVVFSNQISRYYRRVRILTEPKPHLIQTMFARLHLIKACITIYDTLFDCLNITPPNSM